MAVTVNTMYQQCLLVLMEDFGLIPYALGGYTGDLTIMDFLNITAEVITDFLTKTEINNRLVCINVQSGVNTYPTPDQVSDTSYVDYDRMFLFNTSTFYLDNTQANWASSNDTPQYWKEDEIEPDQIFLSPTPTFDGDQVEAVHETSGTITGSGLYGQINAVTDTNDITILGPSTGLFGIINGFTGAPYLQPLKPIYGTINYMVCAQTNLTMIASALPTVFPIDLTTNINNQVILALNSYLEYIPDSFSPAIKYGVLARIYSADGEIKDLQKSYYCQARYGEFINLASAIMSQEFEED